jgi:allophanate hydrolase subunit 2
VKGPHWDLFSEQSARDFVTSGFRISPQSDRMGYRISGPRLAVKKPTQILSEATAFGAVQVPHGGDPIVLMADRQTMGGYPKIAYVVSADLPSLAQSRPGEQVHFNLVSLEQAQTLDKARDAAFTELHARLASVREILSGGSS